jgi:hypothetical protein
MKCMRYEETLTPGNAVMQADHNMRLGSSSAINNTWSKIQPYNRHIGIAIWLGLLLAAPFMVINEYLATNPAILLGWVALFFIIPFTAFKSLPSLRQLGLLLMTTLIIAAPFFLVNACLHAHHMMTLGSAGLTQTEIPAEQMRVLWLSLVLGDILAFMSLAVATVITFNVMRSGGTNGLMKQMFLELLRLLTTIRFWLFAAAQIIIFAIINLPSGAQKLTGMLLFGLSIFLLLRFQKRTTSVHAQNFSKTGWPDRIAITLALISIPALFILLNGFIDYLILMQMDMSATHLLNWFEQGSPMPGFLAISTAKFMSQWLNIWPMYLLLCTALASCPGIINQPEN